jgi:hypothetical protein
MRRIALAVATTTMIAMIAIPSTAARRAARFAPPVKVTPDLGGGYEPAVYGDRFGNLFATAHKLVQQLVIAPDSRAPTGTRSMSWAWMSSDGGASWQNLPGMPLDLEKHDFGDEGDMAIDDADHLYFVDTNVADVTLTRWTIKGLGEVTFDYHRPVLPAGEAVDDRPWIEAKGSGLVFYMGNEGDSHTYPAGHGSGSGFGPGRYTLYRSTDGGQTFDNLGYTLKGSGWCRAAADHTKRSHYVYVVCTNDGEIASPVDEATSTYGNHGLVYAYVSSNDGATFTRHTVGKYVGRNSAQEWPGTVVAPDGSIWSLLVDAGKLDGTNPVTNRLILFHSTNHGRSWSRRDITPVAGRYRFSWFDISPDGKHLGLGVYYKAPNKNVFRVYGAIWKPGEIPALVSLDEGHPVSPPGEEPPHDLMGAAFRSDGMLGVMWTRHVDGTESGVERNTAYRDIYFARSR